MLELSLVLVAGRHSTKSKRGGLTTTRHVPTPHWRGSQAPVIAGGKFLGMASTSSIKDWNELRAINEAEGRAFLSSFSYVAARPW